MSDRFIGSGNSEPEEIRASIYLKLHKHPNFSKLCALAFYNDLFDVMPGLRPMFGSMDGQIRMFSMLVEVVTSTSDQQEEMEHRLRQLGRKHAEIGVTSLHMKVARSCLLKAVTESCPELDELELDYFGTCYMKIVSAMNEQAPILIVPSPD